MKAQFLLYFIFSTTVLAAQHKETFYNADWQPSDELEARFVSYVRKTDSGWLQLDYYLANKQLQMRSLFSDEKCTQRTGEAVWFHPNGNVATWAHYKNNQLHGPYQRYYSNGMMRDSGFFDNGKQIGERLGWHRNGMMSDSSIAINDSTLVSVSWFENGELSSAGYYVYGKKKARWKYYHNNGSIACTEYYINGKITEVSYFDKEGNPEKLGVNDADAEFKGGMKSWMKKVESKLYWPNGLEFSKGNMAIVVVDLFIDETGKVAHAEVVVPFYKDFDKIALNAVQTAGNWLPAVSKNRNIPFWIRQKIRFSQPE